MDEINNGGAATVAPTTATTADAGTQGQQQQGSDEPLRNYREVVELRKEVREMAKLMKDLAGRQGPTETSKPAAAEAKPEGRSGGAEAFAEVTALRRELAIEKACTELGVTSPTLRDLIERATVQASPADVRSIVEKVAGELRPAAVRETPPTPPPPATAPATQPARSNTGAPGVDGKIALPEDPRLIDPETWKGMTSKERIERHQANQRRAGMNANPFPRREIK